MWSLTWPRQWKYAAEGDRDLRLDLVRGLCVLGMVCNHVAGSSWVRTISLSNNVLVTPAEGFVFLSGYVLGSINRRRIANHGLRSAVDKCLHRALLLYVITVTLSLLFEAALLYDHGQDLASVESLPRFIASIVLLQRTVYLVDAMLMYTLLCLFACLGLWALARGRTAFLMVASLALWLTYQLEPDWAASLPWPIVDNTVFHITAWQLPFAVGLCIGFHRERLGARYAAHQTHLVLVAALAFAALVYVEFSYGQLGLIQALSAKPAEGPIRVLACAFVFQIVRLVMTYGWAPIRTLVGWFLLPLGQNSLYAYAMHIGLIAAMWIPAEYVTQSESWNTLLQLGTAVIVWGMIKWKAGYSVRPTWVLRRRPQAVADAADRLDEPRRTHVDLAAQVANVHVNRVTGADPVISPHTIQNDLPRQDLAGVRHEQLEQIEFARAQLHRRAIAADGPGDAIQ